MEFLTIPLWQYKSKNALIFSTILDIIILFGIFTLKQDMEKISSTIKADALFQSLATDEI